MGPTVSNHGHPCTVVHGCRPMWPSCWAVDAHRHNRKRPWTYACPVRMSVSISGGNHVHSNPPTTPLSLSLDSTHPNPPNPNPITLTLTNNLPYLAVGKF